MRICDDLRQAVLQAAIQGKLTKQLPEDGNAADLLKQIATEKAKLIKEGIIKKEKALPEITPVEVPYDVPDNWVWVRLKDVCKSIQDGDHQPPPQSPTGIPFIVISNISSGKMNLSETRYVPTDYFKSLSYERIGEIGDILFTVTGSYGIAVPVDIDVRFCFQRHMALLKPIKVNRYLLLALKSPCIKAQSDDKATGTAQKTVGLKSLQKMIIPLPPLEEQHRIVARVEELMARIDDLEKTETELEILKAAFPGDMKAALLQAAMQGKLTEQLPEDGDAANLINQIVKEKSQLIKKGKIKTEKPLPEISADEVPFDVPENWRWSILGDIAEMYTGNSISETEKAKKYTGLDKGYDYIGTKDIGFDGTIKYDNGVKIPFDSDKFRNAYPDATLLCIEGGSAGRKIAMLNKKVCFGNKLCMFYSGLINKKYLYYYLQSPDFLDAFKNNVSGIIGGVSIKKLKSMLIPVPPLAEQKRIVEKLDKLLPLCDGLVEE